MITRTFQAYSLRDAMRLVKQQLGRDAIILGTREVRAARKEGPTRFEVTARGEALQPGVATATAEQLPPTPPPLPLASRRQTHKRAETRRRERPRRGDAESTADVFDMVSLRSELSGLRKELDTLRGEAGGWREVETRLGDTLDALRSEVSRLTHALTAGRGPTQETDPEVRGLIAAGVEAPIASALVERARSRAAPAAGVAVARPPDLVGEILACLPAAPSIFRARAEGVSGPRVAALVGPTGAGKTRTLVKLAAQATFAHDRRVAVVTTDAHRIGGVEPLQAFCKIVRIPLRQASSREEAQRALRTIGSGKDLVLIDTPGCGPWDEDGLAYLTDVLGGSRIERHLVVSATSRADDVRALARRFGGDGLDSMIVTKLDEARGPGALLSAAWGSGARLSHVCDGQGVPEACYVLDAMDWAERIVARAA